MKHGSFLKPYQVNYSDRCKPKTKGVDTKMALDEQEFRDCASAITDLCQARGLNLKQTGRVCEFVCECVCLTEIISGAD